MFVSLLPKIVRISYIIGAYMEWNPKQHPSMYHVITTYHRHRNNVMIILLPMTETSYPDGTAVYDESRSNIINKISNLPKNSSSFNLLRWGQTFLQDMAISRFNLVNSWPRSQARSVVYMRQINQHCFSFVQTGPCILNLLRPGDAYMRR